MKNNFKPGPDGPPQREMDGATTEVVGRVRSAATGDLQSWNWLVNQYGRLIWSIAVNFKLPEGDAADVVQTTWMRLIEHIDRIEHPEKVGSWLASTARNECLRSLAARKRVVLGRDEIEMDRALPRGPEVDERLLADERAEVVR